MLLEDLLTEQHKFKNLFKKRKEKCLICFDKKICVKNICYPTHNICFSCYVKYLADCSNNSCPICKQSFISTGDHLNKFHYTWFKNWKQ
jgi:hypothetical protein